MEYRFNDPSVQKRYGEFLDKIAPRLGEIETFCNTAPEDNIGTLKRMLYDYASHTNFLSFNYKFAVTFYKIALSQEWEKEGEFKGSEERKVRARVEMRCIEPEAVLVQFEKLIKGLSTSLTAVQTALNAEKSLLSNRENQ
jgi:outer membrane receptor for Fe3+-dicitrate